MSRGGQDVPSGPLKGVEYIYNELRVADANDYIPVAVRDLIDHAKEVKSGEKLDIDLIREILNKINDFFSI